MAFLTSKWLPGDTNNLPFPNLVCLLQKYIGNKVLLNEQRVGKTQSIVNKLTAMMQRREIDHHKMLKAPEKCSK